MEAMWVLLMIFFICDGFNINVDEVENFLGNPDEFFGYRVLQDQSDEIKQIIISAPLASDSSGSIYSCSVEEKNCTLIYTPVAGPFNRLSFFGMSLAVTPSSPHLTSCSPSLAHECDGNSYLNSFCYQFNSQLKLISNFTPAFPECTKANVNLIFLFDGSTSMRADEFTKNKVFIWDIITKLQNTSIQFAAVQFSSGYRTVFTFKDYVNKTAKEKLDKEEHMKSLTNTHKAIKFTLDHLFDNVTAGADPDAMKALVIITDGDPTDQDKGEVKRCEELNIKRFVIGVGKVKLDKLRSLASEPKINNTFKIENYAGLNGLLDQLQNKIYSIEGTQHGSRRIWERELSQTGFSAAYNEDSLILGAVGSNNWRGLLYEVTGSGAEMKETEMKDPDLKEDSYQGYSVAVGRREKVPLVFSGAPRSDHRGRVTLFSKQNHKWGVSARVSGEQIGSYFGSSVCVMDVDLDSETDFLLVGAPQYHQAHPQREGRLYVYQVTLELQLEEVMTISESSDGRFGATLAAIADLNGDKIQDLAVGAPQEDGGKGAIFIYLGNDTNGIRPQYSQRISARMISETLQQFGVAIDGMMDMGQDGVPDITVGARGAVVLLKGRPVLSVSADLRFSPSEIKLSNFDCLDKVESTFPVVNLTVCFLMAESTNSTGGLKPNLNLTYELNADALRREGRGFFIKEDKKHRKLQKSELLESDRSCFIHTLYMASCVKDTVSPLFIQLIFNQSDQQHKSAVLNIDSRLNTSVEVPFQRNCRENTTCVADLEVNFSFKNSTLLVVDQDYFNITVSLLNKGDDSFNTSLVLFYPQGLSLAIFETIKASRRTLSRCGDRDNGALNKTTCSISLPVYRQNTEAEFQGTFRISQHYNWSDTMEMSLKASSDNNNNKSKSMVTKTLPVQFAVDLGISLVPDKSVEYLNFSIQDRGPKDIFIGFIVRNMGMKDLPVRVNFTVPTNSGKNFSLDDHDITVQNNLTKCDKITSSSNVCFSGPCVKFACEFFSLDRAAEVQFLLKAHATFQNPNKYTGMGYFQEFRMEDVFSVSAQLDFNKQRFYQISNVGESDSSRFHRAEFTVRLELVIPPHLMMIYGAGVFGGILLLIIFIVLLVKCGFFKRKHIEDMQLATETESGLIAQDEMDSCKLKKDSSSCPPEETSLVSSGEKPGASNGGTGGGEANNEVSTE